MTDQTIHDVTPEDMEHARSYVQHFLDAMYASDRTLAVARVLQALLPPPPLPTLADMTPEERRACRRMQCEVRGERRIITLVFNDGNEDLAATLDSSGHTIHCPVERVTPRPDLPRLAWPGDENPAPVLPEGWRLADHREYGRVIVTNAEPDEDGDVAFVHRADYLHRQHAHDYCKPDELTYIDGPESPAPVRVGDEIASADDPRIERLPIGSVLHDRYGYTVKKVEGGYWRGGGVAPLPIQGDQFGPWTVRSIGKEADQ